MNDKLSLYFKITNWCNLHCDHCCERSNKNNKPNYMPLGKIEKYMGEYKTLPIKPVEYICIGGGEPLATYMIGDKKFATYIPDAMNLIYSGKYTPAIKTNGTWGNDKHLRLKILYDIAKQAYDHNNIASLEISIDEFRKNQHAVAEIINAVICEPVFSIPTKISLVGFDTVGSAIALQSLYNELQSKKLKLEPISDKHQFLLEQGYLPTIDMAVTAPNGNQIGICQEFVSKIYPFGRAKQTKTYTTAETQDYDGIDCLQIDNSDNAILNYQYREPIKNRPLQTVLESLKQKVQ